MVDETYVDLEILAAAEEASYLVKISKEDLNTLVRFSDSLVIRNWDGHDLAVLEPYGKSAVRTKEDASEKNNLAKLPSVTNKDLNSILG